ncbi:MAG: LAGLIDADG family homing endonuclease [Candidatus Aenigmatarchaeota archaeon]
MTTLKPIIEQQGTVSEAKARILANLKADGSTCRSGTNYTKKYEVRDAEQLNRFAKDLKHVYGLNIKRMLNTSGITGMPIEAVYLRSKLAFEDLQKFGRFRSEDWNVPQQIKNSSKQVKAAFLMAFFDDEGSVIKSRREIRLYSINIDGLNEIAKLLEEFEIKCSIRSGYGKRRNVFAIIIRGVENLERFSKHIGFGVKTKKRKLKSMLSTVAKGEHAKCLLR